MTDFVKSNNLKQKETNYNNIHSVLLRNFKLISPGIYFLNESDLPEHISASKSIIILLKESGCLSEEDIIFKLKYKFSRWNIKLAIKNVSDKLLFCDGKFRLRVEYQ